MSIRDVRLAREAASARRTKDPCFTLAPEGVSLGVWRCEIKGPEGTPYEGGRFVFEMAVPETYPHAPPRVTATHPIFHPNIHVSKGDVCLDILKTEWTPAWNLVGICRALLVLLQEPDPSSPLNCDAANMLRAGDKRAYRSVCRYYMHLYPEDKK